MLRWLVGRCVPDRALHWEADEGFDAPDLNQVLAPYEEVAAMTAPPRHRPVPTHSTRNEIAGVDEPHGVPGLGE
jgi:hypothetical protein